MQDIKFSKSLRDLTVSSIKWSGLRTIITNIIQVVVSIILAKLLTPEIFGIAALLNVIVTFSQILIISGFGTAIIQKKEITPLDLNTIFIFNISISVTISLILMLSANMISGYFGILILKDLIPYYSLMIFISSFSVVPRAVLARNMKYNKIALISIISIVVSGIVAVLLAFNGSGIWSIVGQQITYSISVSSMVLYSSKWRFNIRYSLKSIKTIGAFGFKLMLAQLFNASTQGIINAILAKYYPMSALGIYDRSFRYSELPSKIVKSIISNVYLSSLSKIQDDTVRMFHYFNKTINYIYIFYTPGIFTLYIVFKLLVIFLGPIWEPMQPIFSILLVKAIFSPLHSLNLTIIKTRGKGNYLLIVEVIKKVLLLCVIVITFKFGILGLAVGQLIAGFIEYLINSLYTNKLFSIRWFYQIMVIIRSSFPFIIVLSVFELIFKVASNYQGNIVMWLFGIFIYYIIIYHWQRASLKEIYTIIKKKGLA
jgi:O-antigen/teichoic acid export membrane protein